MDLLVSVVVPAFNRRAMVAEAIASVLAQSGGRFELIVIDDGSTDGTWDALRAMAAEADIPAHIELRIDRQAHRGVAAARNRGIALARAPWIAFLDSDDLWAPRKLQRQLEFMARHPQLRISQTQELWIRHGRRVNPGRRHLKRAGDIFIDSLATCLISPSAVIVDAAVLREAGGFDESMAACEDYDLWLRLLVDREAGLLDEPLVTRRAGHPDQLSAAIPALDRFRVLALVKLLASDRLDSRRRGAVCETLVAKCRIYAMGLQRRGRNAAAGALREIAELAARSWPHAAIDDFAQPLAVLRRLTRDHHMPHGAAIEGDSRVTP
jgi:glycosyltransferase involved in cell wall biosynthesis